MGLDDNQYSAYKTALTSELSIIQGPPGTGKTFIGLQIVKTLLYNKGENFSVPNSPILILCYTNHALDQFLEQILNESRSFRIVNLIRVGGQCKSDKLKGYTLHEKRLKQDRSTSEERSLYRCIKSIENTVSILNRNIKELENTRGIHDFNNIGLWGKVGIKFPHCLQWALKSGDWLGVPEYSIREPLENELIELVLEGDNNKMKKDDKNPSKSYEDEKDNDMNELLENRLAENYYRENFDPKKISLNDEYLTNCSTFGCWEKAKELEDKIAAITDPKFLRYRDELELDRQDYLKRAKFLGTLFDLHEHGHLQLPNVDDYLRPEEVKRIVRECRPIVRSRPDWESDSDYERLYRQREDGYDTDDDDYVYVERTVDGFVYSQPEFSANGFSMRERWALYFKVVEIALTFGREELRKGEEELGPLRKRLREKRQKQDVVLLQKADVIGMTTTGAAKNHLLLEAAKPQIVVIEEAAEILEAHMVTSLTEDCSQLILIGDHLQLRPSTNVYELEKKYHMNVSLFERMILNNINLCTLKTQHRMRPEIADLIVGPIYSQLDNHAKVLEYPQVRGLTKNLYFLTHSQLENTDSELLSKSNYFEANFISGLCEYLLQQGYKSHQITILTTYTGQMFLLKKVISEACADVRITCVDNYQGEENDIILLSLVRSNEEDKIGFVGIDNRICVSLSRAKHGLYIVGNLECLMRTSPTWKQIGAKLKAGENCGESLELSCVQHGHKTRVSERSHFAPGNLNCGLKCDKVLDCGHSCPFNCHLHDHEKYRCVQKCEKKCPLGHPCLAKCGEQCPPCQTLLLKALRCGHNVQIPCCIEALPYLCPVPVTKELQCELKHEKEVPCYKHVSLVKCDILVEKKLEPCGHVRPIQCHQSIDEVSCDAEIDHIFSACNHSRRICCWEKKKSRVTCEDKCGKVLDCGHECPEVCHVYDKPIHKYYVCKQKCRRVCALDHPCQFKHLCHGKCPPCPTLIIKTLECGHEVELPCRKNPSTHACTERLTRKLTCGHEMLVRCGRKVEDYKCKEGCLREVTIRN